MKGILCLALLTPQSFGLREVAPNASSANRPFLASVAALLLTQSVLSTPKTKTPTNPRTGLGTAKALYATGSGDGRGRDV